MNFKDIYKSANDDIHADRALIDNIIAKSETGHKPRFKMQYVYAAAAVAVAVSVSLFAKMPPDDKSPEQIASNTESAADDNTAASHDDLTKKAETKDETHYTNDTAMPEKTNSSSESASAVKPKSDSSAAVSQTEQLSEKDYSDSGEKIQNEQSNYDKESTGSVAMMKEAGPVDDSIKVNVQSPARRGAGGYFSTSGAECAKLAIDTADAGVQWEQMTYGEYCSYLGIDILKKAQLPSDMKFYESDNVGVQKTDNEITNDEAYFSADNSDGSKYVQIVTAKISGKANDYVSSSDYKKSSFNGKDAVIIYNGSMYEAYFMYNDVSVSVTAHSVTEDELKALLSSLTK